MDLSQRDTAEESSLCFQNLSCFFPADLSFHPPSAVVLFQSVLYKPLPLVVQSPLVVLCTWLKEDSESKSILKV